MSELKMQILQTLSKMHEVQEQQHELVQHLSHKVERLEKDLAMAKQLQSDLDENLNAVAQFSEALSLDSRRSQSSRSRRNEG